MNVGEIFDEVFIKTTKINNCWRENSVSSKKIRKETEYNFFYNKEIDFISKFAYFYALENRIKEKYNSIFKIIFRFFSWKKETNLLSKIKKFLKTPEFLDAKSIILQKSEDKINGKDCFDENNNSVENLQNKIQEKKDIKKDKQIETKVSSKIDNEINNEQIEEKDEDTEIEDVNLKTTESGNEEISSKQNLEINSQEQSKNETLKENSNLGGKDKVSTNKNVATREKIEISKDDLLNFKNEKKKISNKNESSDLSKIETNKNQNELELSINSDIIIDDIFLKNHKQHDSKTLPYYQPSQNLDDINFAQNQNHFSKKENDLIHNFNQSPKKSNFSDYNVSNQQINKIASDEISKISEKDMQAIKDYMQEELNRQMIIAEEKGEIYKMPLSIKEVIDSKSSEKSEVQINREHNTILNNKK